ncbi:MAG: hypothetical protein IKD79_04270, partial [Oscillospiraceae bacterium]|nr:hypothetical protein [Oscillospiraceae bacterium]
AVDPAPVRDAAVLEGMPAVDAAPPAAGGGGPSGFAKFTGSLPETAADSPVYLLAEGAVYEAIPDEGRFTAWLPEGIGPEGVEVYIRK